MLRRARRIAGAVKRHLFPRPDIDAFLGRCRGVIHVGANTGQERDLYANHELLVVWIEPIDEQFRILEDNLRDFPQQIAIKALIAERDGAQKTLHISNNDGKSSSILDLHMHKDIWPEIHYVKHVTLTALTLGTALEKVGISPTPYDALVIDTQGSELLVLRGAEPILQTFKFIKTEAADFESYKGCATVSDITAFLRKHGFKMLIKDQTSRHPTGAGYFDILYRRL